MSDPITLDRRALRAESITTLTAAAQEHRSHLAAWSGLARGGQTGLEGPTLAACLSLLAVVTALIERLMPEVASTMVAALRNGGTLDQLVDATGLDVEEVLVECRSWLSSAAETGEMSGDELDAAAAAVDRAEAAAVAAYDAHTERLRRGEADPGDELDAMLVAWMRDARRAGIDLSAAVDGAAIMRRVADERDAAEDGEQ